MDFSTWFDRIFPAFMTGWKTWLALVLWLFWTMFVQPVVNIDGADQIVTFFLAAFGGAAFTAKLKRWEQIFIENQGSGE